MTRGGPVKPVALAVVLVLIAVAGMAGPAGTVRTASVPLDRPGTPAGGAADGAVVGTASATGGGAVPDLPIGQARVRTDKNCYLPGQYVSITLKNVGTAPLHYGSLPDYVIENDTIGEVRMIRTFSTGSFVMYPGDTRSWIWDQRWDAWDEFGAPIHKGELVPRGGYTVNIEVWSGFPLGEVVTIAVSRFTIGDCFARISAGPDITVDEGQTFQFQPVVDITGNAVVKSVTWDVNPNVDSNGDGNFTNDPDLLGLHPTYAFGDNGFYNVTMTLKGTGTISGMDRTPQDVIFALDSSESMNWSDPNGLRKTASKGYADFLVPEDRGAVVDFNQYGHLTGGDHLGTNYTHVKANIDSVGNSGPLFMAAGLLVSLWELRDYGNASHKRVVIYMSSAESDNPRDAYYIPQAISLAKTLNATVYTVGLSITDPDLVQLMKSIAQETGGKYYSAPTATNMRAIYNDIGAVTNWTKTLPFTVTDSLTVTAVNVPPTLAIDDTFPLDVTLRVAGEKYHDVTMVLTRDGAEVARAAVERVPGDPDNQSASIVLDVSIVGRYALRLEYTPLDDPSQGNGANPAWIILALPDGSNLTFHHVFNVGHPGDWVWELPDLQRFYLGRTIALTAHITDPGSDDETVVWNWGDGAVDTRVFYNDGVGPDPYPSPWGSPVNLTLGFRHTYAAAGDYSVLVTVFDDDGGTTAVSFTLTIP